MRPRVYQSILADHLQRRRQMAFVSGPRQVGKTTTCRSAVEGARYLSWDDLDDRRRILRGPAAVLEDLGLDVLEPGPPVLVLDEIHKYARWKTLLKGLFDKHGDRLRVIVTGSSRLDVYRRGGDSLMGRYLLYRMHPLSVAELLHTEVPTKPLRPPKHLDEVDFTALLEHGGFPEPFIARDTRFTHQWRGLRLAQLLREDIRDLTRIQEVGQLEVAMRLLLEWSGTSLVYSSLAREVAVSVDTARRWVQALCSLHFGFLVRPWFRNVAKSLRKEPKWYASDWGMVDDPGQRAETLVACHLLKAVQGWQDLGLGKFDLCYLRDKGQREVDFVVVRDRKPWFLVEVKAADTSLSPSLEHFQRQVGAPHAFHVVLKLDYVDVDPFTRRDPCVVPARTLLSQLL